MCRKIFKFRSIEEIVQVEVPLGKYIDDKMLH